ncbi:glutamate receptor 2.8-like isoform X2 [Magnolia sinica]|uniref:glutamate receptor 2.8-like isoform X2 n=1 Tax=Magnolia sinica TaxID=86752 RepID=UPI0026580DDA|nr:glutamate receptor 2.8-like isoform X2 [Magnolia sinica]
MKEEMKFLQMPFLFMLLLCSSPKAKAAAVNGANGSETIHNGGPMGLEPAVSGLIRLAEVQEESRPQTGHHEHFLANMESGLIFKNQVRYFFYVMENNPNKERTIITFIPSKQTSLTAFCMKAFHAVKDFSLEAFAAAMETFLYLISSKFLSSENNSKDTLLPSSKKTSEVAYAGSSTIMANRENHMDFMQIYAEIEVYEVLEIMDCDNYSELHMESFQSLFLIIPLLVTLTWILILICKLKIVPRLQQMQWQWQQAVSLSWNHLTFAHKEEVESNCSRFVINLATIILLIMAMGYVARWMSIRTVEKLQSTTNNDSKEFGVHASHSRSLLSNRDRLPNQTWISNKETVIFNQHSGALEHNDRSRRSTAVVSGGTTDLKLRIAVPLKNGFQEFIKIDHDSKENHLIVSGFVIDVFKDAMDALPYRVSCEFIPFENGHENSSGYYNDLIYQLNLRVQKYDGVVGDVTITASRLKHGDFTVPYMMSGVAMIVPIEEENGMNSLWWFFKPLSMETWLLIITLFMLKGVLVWIFEHETNQEFQGTPSEQVGKILSFSFSIFVFAHKEKLESNYSKFILNLWMFMVFVIVTIYAANVSLMLSIKSPQLTVTNLESLIENGDCVGYQKGSFVFELLKQWGFQESKLKAYATEAEYAEALLRGSGNNGVSAIVDEIPYIRVFLTHYGHRYAMGGLTHVTGGFSFVFARGSKIVHDISVAILELEERGIISNIKRKWFEPITCPDPPQSSSTYKKLDPHVFRGLLIFTEASTGAVLVPFIIFCIYKRFMKDSITRRWERIKAILSHLSNYWWANSSQSTVEISSLQEADTSSHMNEGGPDV